MGINYSQKQLLNKNLYEEGSEPVPTSPVEKPKGKLSEHLEIYAFWTGVASTVISLLETIIIALKK